MSSQAAVGCCSSSQTCRQSQFMCSCGAENDDDGEFVYQMGQAAAWEPILHYG